MANITTQLLLSQQVHPDDVTSETSVGDAAKANGYYGQADGKHTVQFSVTDFVGKIRIEGSLATEPGDAEWCTIELGHGVATMDTTGVISEENITYLEYTEATSANVSYNFTGNFVKVRAVVYDWTEGTVNSIRVNY